MPDIRNFFGAKGTGSTASSQDKTVKKDKKDAENTGALKRKRTGVSKVIDDSGDDDYQDGTNKATPKKSTPPKRVKKESLKGKETSAKEYFQSSSKPKSARTTRTSTRQSTEKNKGASTTVKPSPGKASASKVDKDPESSKRAADGPKSSRRKNTTTYTELSENDDVTFLDSDKDAGDDIFSAQFKKGRGKGGDDYMEDEQEEDEAFDPPAVNSGKSKSSIQKSQDVDMMDVDSPQANGLSGQGRGKHANNAGKASSKTKTAVVSLDTDEDEEAEARQDGAKKKGQVKSKSSAKATPANKARTPSKKQDVPENKEMQKIFDSIPTVPLPDTGPPSAEPRKFNYQNHAQHSAPPPGAGTKDMPTGAENCLAGLTFVFTGTLDTLGREAGQELVKRYGGKVTTAPSGKTNYVVLGAEAGPKKIEMIRKNKIPTINEDGLFELIRKLPPNGGDSKAAAAHEEKKQKEEQKVKEMAAQMEREEKRLGGAGGAGLAGSSQPTKGGVAKTGPTVENRLWTVKYAPSAMSHICGNKGPVEKLQRWLREWPKSQRIKFKKAGPDGSYCFRAVIIHGPPGIGKTTAAHLVAKLEGYDIVESNASDSRSKKLVETGLRGVLDNTSLLGYFAGDQKPVEASKKKLVLIMDEVDGMSAGDRGGVGALAQVCKKTNIPMILICNERRLPKMKPFDHCTYDLTFRRPTINDIRSRIASICFREGLKLPGQVIDALVEGSHADIRQIINMISTAKLDQEAMSFDEGKSMSKAWQKHVILKPWDIAHQILSPGMFGASSNKTLNDKIELYFNDHEFSYLMLQENYLKTRPSIANNYSGRERTLKLLELADKAAESISDGDLVDRMIHGPQQHWSLMPTHAIFSTVRPASFVYGTLGGQGGQIAFTTWLGNNSKQAQVVASGKLSRFVKEIQGHMRLRASGDRHEIRQQYLPSLWYEMIQKMQIQGKEAVQDVIDLMDSYFLTKEDYDAIMELGVGPMDMERVRIDTQTKATFTRLYNQQSHPLPFIKASTVVAPKTASRDKPDLEEAIEESEEDDELLAADPDVKKEDEEANLDLSKDKYVKQPKKKAAPNKTAAKKAPTTKKGKAKADESEEEEEEVDDESEEEIKPTKGRGSKAKASTTTGKGRAKK
ncbi:MAG: hypothetical protein M1816_002301 [Peltula sp. TS41687]|nr:MAG: hypothetical protein M1816_002301 [Peltula sp. TS41687]